jgi:hypothetical protein
MEAGQRGLGRFRRMRPIRIPYQFASIRRIRASTMPNGGQKNCRFENLRFERAYEDRTDACGFDLDSSQAQSFSARSERGAAKSVQLQLFK